MNLLESDAAVSQIVHADVLVLNKVDLADEETIASIQTKVQSLAPTARLLRTRNAAVPRNAIVNAVLLKPDSVEMERDDSSNHLTEDGFTSVSFQSDQPFSIRKFQAFVSGLASQNVFRAKGIVWFRESPARHLFQLTGSRFTIDPSEWRGDRKCQVVLIGQRLDRQALLGQLASCIAATSEGTSDS
jgi:G3E family GTPase